MNFESYSKEFIIKAQQVGYSAENIDKCLSYAESLIAANLPVIYNTSHLSGLVGYRNSYLNRAVVFTHFFYRHFKIKKSTSGYRNISEPLPSL
jgi:RNA-directed DNA polymerase